MADDTARAEAREALRWADDAFADDLDPQLRIRRSSLRALLASTEAQPPTESVTVWGPPEQVWGQTIRRGFGTGANGFQAQPPTEPWGFARRYHAAREAWREWCVASGRIEVIVPVEFDAGFHMGVLASTEAQPPTEPTFFQVEAMRDVLRSLGCQAGMDDARLVLAAAAHRTQEGRP